MFQDIRKTWIISHPSAAPRPAHVSHAEIPLLSARVRRRAPLRRSVPLILRQLVVGCGRRLPPLAEAHGFSPTLEAFRSLRGAQHAGDRFCSALTSGLANMKSTARAGETELSSWPKGAEKSEEVALVRLCCLRFTLHNAPLTGQHHCKRRATGGSGGRRRSERRLQRRRSARLGMARRPGSGADSGRHQRGGGRGT